MYSTVPQRSLCPLHSKNPIKQYLRIRTYSARVFAGKGFGKPTETSKQQVTKAPKPKKAPQKQVAEPQSPLDERFKALQEASAYQPPDEDEKEFQRRLAALKRQAEAREKAQAKAVLEQPSVLDASPNIYDNPPPLAQTLFTPPPGRQDDSASSSGGSNATGIAAGVGVFALAAIFLFTEFGGGGLGGPTPSAQVRQLAGEEKSALEGQLAQYEAALKENSADVEALQGAAGVVVALKGDFKAAASYIERWAEAQPTNVDAWEVLAETRARAKEWGKAVAAYERAMAELPQEELGLLQGLASVLVAQGTPQDAVALVRAAEERASAGSPGSLDAYEAKLLLGKVYSQWSRHLAESLAVYDDLIATYPEDYRAFLAKGVLLKANNRAGDAQRMFLQARFLAPPSARAVVDQVVSR